MGVCIRAGKNGISEIIEEMSETGYVKKTAFSDGTGIYGRTGFVFLFSRKWNQNDMAARGSEDIVKKSEKMVADWYERMDILRCPSPTSGFLTVSLKISF